VFDVLLPRYNLMEVISGGAGFTVSDTELLFRPLYDALMFVVPPVPDTPVARPVFVPIVATDVLDDVQVDVVVTFPVLPF